MIDVHCHLVPGIDDGAADLELSITMARMAVADGITAIVCTPHITPGVYENTSETIERGVEDLRQAFADEGIPLELHWGADAHISPGLLPGLVSGVVPTIAKSRYFLFEPPHHVLPPRLEATARSMIAAGYIPIVTHPERLTWIESHYEVVRELSISGALIQLTAGSISGSFGPRARYWSDRLLEEGFVDLIATDAHNASSRPPILSAARDIVGRRLGEEEALQMVLGRPSAILQNLPLQPRGQSGAQRTPGRVDVSDRIKQWVNKWQKH